MGGLGVYGSWLQGVYISELNIAFCSQSPPPPLQRNEGLHIELHANQPHPLFLSFYPKLQIAE